MQTDWAEAIIWQGWVFEEVFIMEQGAAGGDLLWLQHTYLHSHNQIHQHKESESTGGVSAG
jgi:hypothetical protein